MAIRECVACGGLCEPPFTHVDDDEGQPTGYVVCIACLDRLPSFEATAEELQQDPADHTLDPRRDN